MVYMWFKHETNLKTMIDMLEITKEELDKAAWTTSEGLVRSQSSEETNGKSISDVFQLTQGGGR